MKTTYYSILGLLVISTFFLSSFNELKKPFKKREVKFCPKEISKVDSVIITKKNDNTFQIMNIGRDYNESFFFSIPNNYPATESISISYPNTVIKWTPKLAFELNNIVKVSKGKISFLIPSLLQNQITNISITDRQYVSKE